MSVSMTYSMHHDSLSGGRMRSRHSHEMVIDALMRVFGRKDLAGCRGVRCSKLEAIAFAAEV